MFDQIKVNQNSIMNLLTIPDRENADIPAKKPGSDFLSMVMGKTGFEDIKTGDENKLHQIEPLMTNNSSSEPISAGQHNSTSDNSRISGRRDREEKFSNEEKSIPVESAGREIKNEKIQESSNHEVKKNSDGSVKETRAKKNGGKDSEDEAAVLNQFHGESSIKNVMEIIRAAFSGNKKAEEENFEKLFSNLKIRRDRETGSLISSSRKAETDKNQKNPPDFLNSIIKEIKESISREVFKGLENRRAGGKPQILNDKELKELASNIIEGIRKNKTKEAVKPEAKSVTADETKADKKHILSTDHQAVKKTDNPDDSQFDKNGAKDRNHSKDSFSYHGGKIDFSAKSGLEKMEHALKMQDFKEHLQEIIDRAKVTVRDGRNGTFTMKLNPRELGNVNVNLIMENGVINGKFLVDNEDAKNMLLSSLNNLKYQLEDAGINVGEFSVNVNDQRGRYLEQKDDEIPEFLSPADSNGKIIAAAEQYESSAVAYTGHINMVI